MEFKISQISSLEKIHSWDEMPINELYKKTVLAGERFSYQICIRMGLPMWSDVSVTSDLSEHVKLYYVKEALMDMPVTRDYRNPPDDMVNEPGYVPDILVPLEDQQNQVLLTERLTTFWVKIDIPRDIAPGTYPVTINFTAKADDSYSPFRPIHTINRTMQITVLPVAIPEQRLIYTRWFHVDCIAVQHNVEIYSEAHWELMEKYIAAAVDVGINMMLVPIHTPPLDTAIGATRHCVQLVDIEKRGDTYAFSFDKFRRFIDLCKKYGIKYFEMAHMFSQWGAKCAPNIMVNENGKTDYLFGWHVAADSPEYTEFLKQYISAICRELEREGISENTYFHISDEPTLSNLDTYRRASDIIRPLLGNSKTFDALSAYPIYEKGLVECPVTSTSHIHEFLEHPIENQWAYYCCAPLLAEPSYHIRMLGFLLYKYDIKGFLHWGFNFYNSQLSYYPINPYLTTSADGAFPSGDSFIVYPSKDGVYPSIHGEVTYEAIQDMDICFALEEIIGRKAVVEMIDQAAGRNLRFDDYPRNKAFLENLRAAMIEKIREANS